MRWIAAGDRGVPLEEQGLPLFFRGLLADSLTDFLTGFNAGMVTYTVPGTYMEELNWLLSQQGLQEQGLELLSLEMEVLVGTTGPLLSLPPTPHPGDRCRWVPILSSPLSLFTLPW